MYWNVRVPALPAVPDTPVGAGVALTVETTRSTHRSASSKIISLGANSGCVNVITLPLWFHAGSLSSGQGVGTSRIAPSSACQ